MVRIVVVLVCLLVAAGGFGGYIIFSSQTKPTPSASVASQSVRANNPPPATPSRAAAPTRRSAPPPQPSRRAFSGFDPDTSFEPGEVVVVDPPDGFAAAIRTIGYAVVETVFLDDLGVQMLRVKLPSGISVVEGRRRLAARFPGLTIDANHQFDNSQERRSRPSRSATTSRRASTPVQSQARKAIGWQDGSATCGAGVRLGMIDSGVDMNHPALKGQKIEFRSFHDPKRRPGPSVHGTAVAAILVGRPSDKGWGGLLPGAELKAANMFELNETGKKVGNVIGLLKGLNWLAKQKVHAINLSIAGSRNKAVDKAFAIARKKGLVMVAAAGNWGRADKPAYPAAYSDVVAVTAIGPYRGVYKRANRGDYIDFAAPGVRLWTAIPEGGKYQSGTSFAAPYITALAGIEVAKGATRETSALRKLLQGDSRDLGAPGRDTTFGWGLVQRGAGC